MDITTLSLAKKYANKVAAGFSKVEVQENNLIFTLNDGTKATMTVPTPEKGSDGISVVDLSIDTDGSLLCHMSDGSTINAGIIPTFDKKYVDDNINKVDNKIVSTRNELERVKNDVLETGTDTDTYIHLEDSAMAEYQELSVDGVCEQKTTQGYNVLNLSKKPYDESSSTLNGATVTENNGILTIDTTNATDIVTIRSKWKNYTSQNSILLPKGSYYTRLILNIANLSGESKEQLNGNFNLDEDCLMTQWFYNIAKGQKNVELPLLISNDQTKTSYEPYTGGQPSPNPDHPQPISTIENSLKITSCNKNLLGLIDGTYTHNGITAVVDNGKITLNGTAESTSFITIPLVNKINIKNQKITISSNNSKIIEDSLTEMRVYTNGSTYVPCAFTKINNSFTKTNKTDIYVRLQVRTSSGITYNNFILYPQLEKGDKFTPYEQHLETQITANLPEGEFIGKINDKYKDTLKVEYNETDGQYHLVLNKMIGKVVLDGSESWYLNNLNLTNTKVFSFMLTDKPLSDHTQYFKNTRFQETRGWEVLTNTDEEMIQMYTDKTLYIRINNSRATDLNTFKNWLSTHNTEVYYVLATPYTVDLGVVDMPITYNEVTNLFTDSDLMPNINAKYYRNFITTIQNLQVNEKTLKQELIDINTRLSALESASANVVSESEVIE